MRTLKGNDHFGDIGLDGVILVKLISEDLGVCVRGLDLSESRVVCYCVATALMKLWVSLQERNV